MTDLPPTDGQMAEHPLARIVAALNHLVGAFHPGPWQMASVVLFAALILVIINPFAPTPTDPNANDIAQQWSESISRLGIEPVFPPEEDIYVGDIWAIVSSAADRTLLGKSVRIGQYDMRASILATNGTSPLFAQTKVGKPGEGPTFQDDKEIGPPSDDKYISLKAVAFPGVTITHVTKSSAFLGLNVGGAAAERDGLQFEETNIPNAETYGVSTSTAVGALDAWCKAPETSYRCTDKFARSMLSYILGAEPLAPRNGAVGNELKINISMIARVFLTRELDTRRFVRASRGGAIRIVPVPGAEEIKSTSSAQSHEKGGAKSEESASQAMDNRELELQGQADTTNSGGAFLGQRTESSVGLHQIFPRIFGFRTVQIAAPTQ